ncbi:hypothetical protein FBU30_009526 [Linnemannia zychae]|nr:hypothetical protein FBU30_009526 [Linnemannia zychae]
MMIPTESQDELTPSPTSSPKRILEWTPDGSTKRGFIVQRSPIRVSPGVSPSQVHPRSHTFKGWVRGPGSRVNSNSPGSSRASSTSPSKLQSTYVLPQAPPIRRRRLIVDDGPYDDGAESFWRGTHTDSTDSTTPSPNNISKPPNAAVNLGIFKRDGNSVTRNELVIIARVFKVLRDAPETVQTWFRGLGRGDSTRLSLMTGIGRHSCEKAIQFAETGTLDLNDTKRQGRPKKDMGKDYSDALISIVTNSNKLGQPNSSTRIANDLKEKHGINRSRRSVMRDLHKLGFFWGKFVKDSVHIWPAIGKSHIKRADGHLAGPDAHLWSDVPPEIQEAGIIATDHDYHGNFNADLFDKLFQRLCQNLTAMNLGPCNIHLDGASYHFHKLDKKPTASSKKEDILKWLTDQGHDIPPGIEGRDPTKVQLVEYLKTLPDTS